MKLILILSALTLFTASAHARPVSYPGGWTVINENDVDTNSTLVHFSPTAKYSVGVRHDYLRGPEASAATIQLNNLLKRWNAPNSQANLYLRSGVGVITDGDETEAAAFTGIRADWENRRFFTSYSNRFFTSEDITSFAKHEARIGVAPYVGDYGDIHTWLFLQADYDAGEDDTFSLTPLVRFFKGPTLLEAGYNLDGGILFNFTQRF